eukprot:3745983-Rhodomonas_salina.1
MGDAATGGSSGGAGRQMDFFWGVEPGLPGADQPGEFAVSVYLRTVGSATNITIPNAALKYNVVYTIVLQVQNFFGVRAETRIPIVLAELPVPDIFINGGASRTVDKTADF